MTTYYTLSNGTKISGYFWEDYYTGKHLVHDTFEINEYDESGKPKKALSIKYPNDGEIAVTHELKVHEDNMGVKYIMWKGEKIELLNWMYHSIPMLIKEIQWGIDHNDVWFVDRDIILTSLMTNSDKFGVMLHPRIVSFMFPGTSIGICGDPQEDTEVLYIPKIEPLREVKDWFYKIKFWPKEERLRKVCASEEYYFEDFSDMLKRGFIKLVELKGGEN